MEAERCIFQLRDEERSARRRRGLKIDSAARSAPADFGIAALAERQHGVVARRQLLSAGLGRGAIDARIGRGQLHRLHHGVYAVGHRLLTRDGRWMAAVLACGSRAALSHRSAAELWQLLPPGGRLPEVTRPSSSRSRPGIVVHRGTPSVDELAVVNEIPVTSVHRTIFDLAGMSTRRQVERAKNEAEVRGLTDRLSIPDLLERHPGARGAAMLRGLYAEKTPGGRTRNDFEEDFVAFLDAHALPRPAFNAPLAMRGRFFEIDCLWRRHRLAVELDGRAAHGTAAAFESDRERDRILQAEGWRTARITWRQLREDPESVATDLRRLLAD
jgi:very-short-patch-repair endonuclease